MFSARQRTAPTTWTRPWLIPRVRRGLLWAVASFVVALAVLSLEARQAGFEGDEADYVATSRYFGYLFLQRDVARKEWGDNHWTRTQPPLTRYLIGGWLTARGYDLETLNQPYVSTASSLEVNRQKGRVPEDDVLAAARQPMVLLGSGAVALLYPLGAVLGGPLAGGAAVILALTSPFLRYTLVHAWAEAPLAFFLLLAVLLAAAGASRVASGGAWGAWSLGLGLALGLAFGIKLTGAIGAAATGIWALAAAMGIGRPRLVLWSSGAVAVMVCLFVAINPYLWRGPAAGLMGMLQERRDEMAAQQRQWPEFAVLRAAERPGLTVAGSLRVGPWAETLLATPINLALLVLGAGQLAMLRRRGMAPPGGWASASMLIAWLLTSLLVIAWGLGLSYPRYFLPNCLLTLPFAGLGVATAVRSVRKRFNWAGGEASGP
jgi:MFS family permease